MEPLRSFPRNLDVAAKETCFSGVLPWGAEVACSPAAASPDPTAKLCFPQLLPANDARAGYQSRPILGGEEGH